MVAKKISAYELLDNLEYVLEVLAKNYIGEAKTELSTLIHAIDSSDLPSDLALKMQCSLIEGRNNISGANFDVPRSSHHLWEAYKQLKSYLRSMQTSHSSQKVL